MQYIKPKLVKHEELKQVTFSHHPGEPDHPGLLDPHGDSDARSMLIRWLLPPSDRV